MVANSNVLVEMAGWIPAIVFPVATGLQLFKIAKEKDARSISKTTWLMFGLANIGLYIYAEKYTSIQSVGGFLGTALLDFVIVGMAIRLGAGSEEKGEA